MSFSNPTGLSRPATWILNQSSLALRWAENFQKSLKAGAWREQNFFGWDWTAKRKATLFQDLAHSVSNINSHFPNEIPASLLSRLDQKNLNELHHHFEILMGQSWNRSERALSAPLDVQISIRRLNEIVHDFEYCDSPDAYENEGKLWMRGFQMQLVPYEQIPLEDRDLEEFTFSNQPGDLVTNYCQLGKTWVEAFIHQDESIDLANIAPLRYYSSGFICNFHSFSQNQSELLNKNIRNFISKKSEENGVYIDSASNRNALGHARFASLKEDDPLLAMSPMEQVDFFNEFNSVSHIKLSLNGESTEQSFSLQNSLYGEIPINSQARN